MGFVPGSIVKRPVNGFWGLFYNHMGIYIGNDEVVHFSGESKKADDAIIRKDKLQAFAAGHEVRLHASPKNSEHANAICQEAQRLLVNRSNGYNEQYGFVARNCEDFCVHCYEVLYRT